MAYLDKVSEDLTREGVEHNRDIEVGVMIEVPSAVVIADILADMVDFFSIGTNDLVQYSLAIDRGNRHVAHLFQSLHPAVIRMIKHIIEVGAEKDVDVVMCGEMAGVPINLPVLLGLGLSSLSMNLPSIPVIKNVARALSAADSKEFINEVLVQTSSEDINNLVAEKFGTLVLSQ